MTYSKPEIEVLGNASSVILGGMRKDVWFEPPLVHPQRPADCEFDD